MTPNEVISRALADVATILGAARISFPLVTSLSDHGVTRVMYYPAWRAHVACVAQDLEPEWWEPIVYLMDAWGMLCMLTEMRAETPFLERLFTGRVYVLQLLEVADFIAHLRATIPPQIPARIIVL